jgi:hypothetical protein
MGAIDTSNRFIEMDSIELSNLSDTIGRRGREKDEKGFGAHGH